MGMQTWILHRQVCLHVHVVLDADLDRVRMRYSGYACCQDRKSNTDALRTVPT